MKLLHIDSSISGGQSVSRQLTASIVARLRQTTPGLEVTYRDLAIAPVPHQSPPILFAKMKALYDAGALAGHIVETVAAAVQAGAKVDASTQAELAETNVVLDEFLAADIVVLGAPMYNFGISLRRFVAASYLSDRYRPELHYMRGPGPKSLAKTGDR
jgi:FMN-dependent NADH-azoreductase